MLLAAKEKGLNGGERVTLWRILRKMGFKFKDVNNKQSRSKLLGNGQANFNKLTLTSINYFRVTFEPVTFARCAFIIALRNIALDGYLDTRRNI